MTTLPVRVLLLISPLYTDIVTMWVERDCEINEAVSVITVSEILNSLTLEDIQIHFQTLKSWPWGITLVVSGREVHSAGSLWSKK